jgi:hypothetical protein
MVSRLRGFLWLAAALALTGCGGSTAVSTTTTPAPTTSTTAATTTTTEAEPVLQVEELEGFEERSTVFANIELTVTGVRSSNQDPRSYAEDDPDPAIDETTTYAYLDIRATNQTGKSQIGIGIDAFRLAVSGTEIAPDPSMSFLSEVGSLIRPNTTVESFLAFPVEPGTDLARALLVVGAPPDRTEVLPLTGPVPEADYPVTVELTGFAEGVGPTNGGTIVFSALDATFSEDRPHEDSTSPTGERADEGELFLVIHVRAEKVSGRGNDLLHDAFRLLVDGLALAPWDTAEAPGGSVASPTAIPGAATEAWVAFLVPVAAAELALQVGAFDQEPGVIPLDLVPIP